jgi:D-glycero-D-manno-heptose 1,7-bisphosphate phosphatase
MVTNQQGIGLGYYSLDDFLAVNVELFRQLAPFHVRIARVAYCPHTLADFCECRKPAPGMLRSVLEDYRASASDCYMLGDSEADIAAGEAAGCHSILIGSKGTAHHRVETFHEAVDYILVREQSPAA